MAQGDKPWGNAFAPLNTGRGEDEKTVWVELGPVWENDKGYSLELRVQPLHWNDPKQARRIVITRRD
jgi:hypothetical protein